MAGESARDQARRQREKAARLNRSAESWERGADGEEATGRVLDELPSDSWTVFHDIGWPGRRYANIDHVAVGPPGVFMIDSKNWTGAVTVTNGALRVNRWSKARDVVAAADAALAVAGLVPSLRPDLVHPVLCFVREEPIDGRVGDVIVCSTANLLMMLTSRPDVLSRDQQRQVSLDLEAARTNPGATTAVERQPRRPVARRPASSTAQERRRKRGSTGDLVKASVAAVVLGVIFFRPDVATGVADRFAAFWMETVKADTTEQQSPVTDPKGESRTGDRKNADHKRANRD